VEQFFDRPHALVVAKKQPEAHRHLQRSAGRPNRLAANRFPNLLGLRLRKLRLAVVQDQLKFFSAVARYNVVRAYAQQQPSSNLLQYLIADRWPYVSLIDLK
jgi:hypothetical protein